MKLNEISRYKLLKENQDEYYNKMLQRVKDELQIKRPVKIHFQTLGSGQNGATYPDPNSNTIHVFIDPNSDDGIIRTLCHEMVHAKQIDDGDLEISIEGNDIKMYWKGNQVKAAHQRGSEWELEAYNGGRELFDKLSGR